jgi:YggT family protein
MDIVAEMLIMVIGWYIWLLIASAILSWLIVFNVLNARNKFVDRIGDFLYRITEPALRPIRRFVPYIGGVDISPVVLILLLIFAQRMLARVFLA